MAYQCSNCGGTITNADVNVTTDLAQCPVCHSIFKASELIHGTQEAESQARLLEQPAGSKVVIEPGAGTGEYVISLPPTGISTSSGCMGGFAVFWLGFVAVWTFLAAQGGGAFALFSIPFWLVGIGLIIGALNGVVERQTILLGRDALEIKKSRIIGKKQFYAKYDEIDKIHVRHITQSKVTDIAQPYASKLQTTGSKRNKQVNAYFPTIDKGVQQFTFFERVTPPEQEWIVAYLTKIVDSKR